MIASVVACGAWRAIVATEHSSGSSPMRAAPHDRIRPGGGPDAGRATPLLPGLGGGAIESSSAEGALGRRLAASEYPLAVAVLLLKADRDVLRERLLLDRKS